MKNLHPLNLCLFLLLCSFSGIAQINTQSSVYCTVDNRFTQEDYFSTSEIASTLGLTFANVNDWQGTPQDLNLDIYYPSASSDTLSKRPFILLIHGGGFRFGNKASMQNECIRYAQRGFVAATMSYRLGWDQSNSNGQLNAIYRAQQDANAAMRFIIDQSSQYSIDTAWLFVGGRSAGAITAMHTVYIDQPEWELIVPGIGAQLGSLYNSGNNLLHAFNFKGIYNNWGMIIGATASPAEMIPTISFHGVLDNIVPIGNSGNGTVGSASIHDLLLANGVCSELNVDSLGGHGIYTTGSGPEYRVARASCFFKSMFCENCTSQFLTDSIPVNCVTPPFNLDLKVMLEGPYNGSTMLMDDGLRAGNLIPLTEPYTALGYAHIGGGESTVPTVLATTGPDAIIDWVFVELRDVSNCSVPVATRAALLQADGDIVDVDGANGIDFSASGIAAGRYWVVVRHRTHLDVMSAASVIIDGDTGGAYDFIASGAFGSGLKTLTNGDKVMYEGDVNQDGSINAADRSAVWNARNQTGYLVQDSSLDGICDAADRSQNWNNRNQSIQVSPAGSQGSNMLLIGNSFFRPYAEHLEVIALDACFEDHNATTVFRGGNNGRPINFWNDSLSNEHQQIKSILDQGNVEFFGMTAGHDTIGNRIEGHRAWIDYALQSNPNVTIFIAIPPIDFPANWDALATAYGYNSIQDLYTYFVNDLVHDSIVDPLRIEFPSTNIFTIPTGWAAVNLNQMNQDGLLLDNISFMGPKPTSIFTDNKGHQGQIVIETGTLIWLNSIYNVDLSTNTYETGFNTDLHAVAKQIMDSHDSNYKQ